MAWILKCSHFYFQKCYLEDSCGKNYITKMIFRWNLQSYARNIAMEILLLCLASFPGSETGVRCLVTPWSSLPPSGLSLHLLYSRQLHSESAVAFSITDSWLLHQHRGGWVALLCLLSSHFFQDCAAQSRPLTILCRGQLQQQRWVMGCSAMNTEQRGVSQECAHKTLEVLLWTPSLLFQSVGVSSLRLFQKMQHVC